MLDVGDSVYRNEMCVCVGVCMGVSVCLRQRVRAWVSKGERCQALGRVGKRDLRTRVAMCGRARIRGELALQAVLPMLLLLWRNSCGS